MRPKLTLFVSFQDAVAAVNAILAEEAKSGVGGALGAIDGVCTCITQTRMHASACVCVPVCFAVLITLSVQARISQCRIMLVVLHVVMVVAYTQRARRKRTNEG